MGIKSSIFEMFGQSPIKPLEQHIDLVSQCAQKLSPFFETVLADDWQQAQIHLNEIYDFENQADEIKKYLRLHLPKGLFLPIPRSDVLQLLHRQDQIGNKAKDIAGLIFGRKMQIPPTIADDISAFVKRSIDATRQAQKAINELDELLETGFRGREVSLVEDMIIELNAIEHDTDEMQIAIRKKLFTLEKTLPPIDVIFLYKIIENIGDLADVSQSVGGGLQMLLAS